MKFKELSEKEQDKIIESVREYRYQDNWWAEGIADVVDEKLKRIGCSLRRQYKTQPKREMRKGKWVEVPGETVKVCTHDGVYWSTNPYEFVCDVDVDDLKKFLKPWWSQIKLMKALYKAGYKDWIENLSVSFCNDSHNNLHQGVEIDQRQFNDDADIFLNWADTNLTEEALRDRLNEVLNKCAKTLWSWEESYFSDETIREELIEQDEDYEQEAS